MFHSNLPTDLSATKQNQAVHATIEHRLARLGLRQARFRTVGLDNTVTAGYLVAKILIVTFFVIQISAWLHDREFATP